MSATFQASKLNSTKSVFNHFKCPLINDSRLRKTFWIQSVRIFPIHDEGFYFQEAEAPVNYRVSDEHAIAVDTHIFRVSNRTGIAPGKTPLEVEQKLLKAVPKEYLKDAHH